MTRLSSRWLSKRPVVLASGSTARRAMLTAAGIETIIDPAAIDEAEVKRALFADGASPDRAAEALAELKAMRISPRQPGRLVIGADQMLVCDGEWFDKPADRAAAAEQLRRLSGHAHVLHSAAVVCRDGVRLWHATTTARLKVRILTADFIADYLDAAGDAVLSSVGAYQVEGLGAHLFERIDGDPYTILGLPLVPLLGFLRAQGVVAA